jgi:cell wall assembly regulator SMI1
MRFGPFSAVVLAAAAFAAPSPAQSPQVEALLDTASDYVAAYERTFVGVVAEETYRQQVHVPSGRTDARGFPTDTTPQRRDLKSDVLLVRAPAGDRWIQFRDVFEVDGKPVRDRDERLARLFLLPSRDARKQEEEIAAASARYNIGGVNRNVNLPVLALTVLEPENRPWFSFRLGKKSGSNVDLEYQEERSGTLVRTADDQPMPVHGRFTIDAATGRVLASTLAADTPSLRAQIDVTYATEPAVDMVVPREMRERYTVRDGSVTEGRATYARFRRYQVTVEERIGEDTLEAVLTKAGAYVVEFQRRLSGIVSEERYVQDARGVVPVSGGRFVAPAPDRHRELTSDFLLVRPVGSDRWVEFRDVFEVDGKAVRDRGERLARLFLEPTRSTADQIQKIVAESTRYNIGNILRTVNVPVLPLMFLDPTYQPRFRFKRATNTAPVMPFAEPPTDAWAIEYEEVAKQTMIRTTNGRDLPSRGRFWIEPASGRVRMTELVAEDVNLRGTIAVSYHAEPSIGLLVPAEMRERYDVRRDGSRVEGAATYSKFRQFTVSVDEKLAPVVRQ